jgi:di/tricarboxylate transporter
MDALAELQVGGLGVLAWYTLVVILAMVVALARDLARTDYVLLGALALVLVVGAVTPEEAFAGFANPAVLTVGSLFVVAEAIHRTDALRFIDRGLFSRTSSPGPAVSSFMLTTAGLSAVLNNTPVVAMLIPRVQAWSERVGLPASKTLIPLSYAAIAGGLVTLVGTSTNIVVSGLVQSHGLPALGMFDFTWVGVPVVIGVVLFFGLFGSRLLPDRRGPQGVDASAQGEYFFELTVGQGSPLAGKTVEEAGLRALGNAYLVRIRRHGHGEEARPEATLVEGDVLSFTGSRQALEALMETAGLETRRPLEDDDALRRAPLFEAVVAPSSVLVGRTLKQVDFRESFGGVVLALGRQAELIHGPLGRTEIRPGDLLIIEAGDEFAQRWNANRDEFYLVSRIRGAERVQKGGRAPVALSIGFVMVLVSAMNWVPLVTATFVAALAMIVTGCLDGREAQASVDVKVLIVIAAALGIGKAVENVGLSDLMAEALVGALIPLGTISVMVGLYVCTNIMTELITHKAAAVLMVPVALAAAAESGVEPKGFALLVAVAAAASFITPIGYQTNLMVMSAGGYRYKDFVRVGLPVSLLVMTIAVTMIYLVWVR